MRYEKFINELKNIPTIKEKQDALDAINLSSKILFDINKKALESHSQKTSINDLRRELFKIKDELAIKKEQMQEINRYLGHLYLSLQIEFMNHEDGNANPYETHIIKACLKTVEMIHDGIIEINTKIKQDKDWKKWQN